MFQLEEISLVQCYLFVDLLIIFCFKLPFCYFARILNGELTPSKNAQLNPAVCNLGWIDFCWLVTFSSPRPLRKSSSSRTNLYSSFVWLSQYNFNDSLHVWFVLFRYTSPFFFVLWLFCFFALNTWDILLYLFVFHTVKMLPFSGNGRSKGPGRGRTFKEHIITKRFRWGLENVLFALKLSYISLRIDNGKFHTRV